MGESTLSFGKVDMLQSEWVGRIPSNDTQYSIFNIPPFPIDRRSNMYAGLEGLDDATITK